MGLTCEHVSRILGEPVAEGAGVCYSYSEEVQGISAKAGEY